MNKLKVAVFVILFGLFAGRAYAADVTITCNPGGQSSGPPYNCDVSPSRQAPLFNESDYPLFDLKPGDKVERKLKVVNNRDEICYFSLSDAVITHDTETPPGSGDWFSQRLMSEITDGVDSTGVMSLYNLITGIGTNPLYLGSLAAVGDAPANEKEFDWLVTFDKGAGNEYQNARLVFDFDWNFQCGEEPGLPRLYIEKTNNRIGDVLSPGDDVTYTLTITADELIPVFNVFVVDLPPGGFYYRGGTWTANSNVRGNIKGSPTIEPTYASPGTWILGDMEAGEVVTLTYVADIDDDKIPGIYKDIAYTEGTAFSDLSSDRVVGNIDTGVFVGTDVEIDVEEKPKVEVKVEEEGEVLGAVILPATGADNIWAIIVGALFGIGALLVILSIAVKRGWDKKFSKLIGGLFAVLFFVLLASNVYAADLMVRIDEPETPVREDDFKVSFTVLDIQGRAVAVKCFKQSPGEAGFTQFTPDISLGAGGDSGTCPGTSDVLDEEGSYKFYITAHVSGDSETSQTITIDFDSNKPGKPHDLKKEKADNCKYEISFTTDDDDGDTVKVEVYRSDEKEFEADNGTRIETVNIGSDETETIIDTKPNCSETYYYAVRAFDVAGNGSGILAESLEVVSTLKEGETVFGEIIEAIAVEEGAVGAEPGAEEAEGTVEEGPVVEEEGEVLGEAGQPAEAVEGVVDAVSSFFSTRLGRFVFVVGGILVVFVIYYVKKQREPRP